MAKLGPLIGCTALLATHVVVAQSAPKTPAAVSIDINNPEAQKAAHDLARKPPEPPPHGHHFVEDRSGRKQSGKASLYASQFKGRRMANGHRLNPGTHAAASKTLPLGTVAKVTNLDNGKTAMVTVEDHGPYVDGRTVDVTRSSAEQLGIGSREGVAPVIVAPVAVPQPDGTVKPGAGAVPGPATAQ